MSYLENSDLNTLFKQYHQLLSYFVAFPFPSQDRIKPRALFLLGTHHDGATTTSRMRFRQSEIRGESSVMRSLE